MRVRQAIAIVNSNLQENVSGVRVIQSLSREDVNAQRFSALNEDNMRANIQAGRLQAAVMPMVELRLLRGDGAGRLLRRPSGAERRDIARRARAVHLLHRALLPAHPRAGDAVHAAPARHGRRRPRLRGARHEAGDRRRARRRRARRHPAARSTFDHVDFDYVEGVPVLRDINLDVQPGETIALVGSTGAGKTTLTALILRFYEVTRGRILIDGIDLKDINRALADPAHRRRAAGPVPVLRHASRTTSSTAASTRRTTRSSRPRGRSARTTSS